MIDISTRFMGLALPNPVVVSSSGLTAKIEGVRRAADAGAGAVVLKSLFEEDIAASVEKTRGSQMSAHPEADSYLDQFGMLLEPDEYLSFVEESAAQLDIPVIASLNCHSRHWWADYAERIEKVGADAIELNLSPMSLNVKVSAADIEESLIEMVRLARKTVNLPLAVKIGSNFSALPHLVNRLQKAGADAVTLFNRYYTVDIDIVNISLKPGTSLSCREEFSSVLRWIGIVSDLTDMDIAASTGVYEASDLIKVILAGGDVGQFCSVLYRDGLKVIGTILSDLRSWMETHQYRNISEFHSLLSLEDDKRNEFYQRVQYVKALKGV